MAMPRIMVREDKLGGGVAGDLPQVFHEGEVAELEGVPLMFILYRLVTATP